MMQRGELKAMCNVSNRAGAGAAEGVRVKPQQHQWRLQAAAAAEHAGRCPVMMMMIYVTV